MQTIISDVQIIPVKPKDGLVAFASFVLFESIWCSSVGVITRPKGGYRLVYPTKKVGDKQQNIFHPINAVVGSQIEVTVSKYVDELLLNS